MPTSKRVRNINDNRTCDCWCRKAVSMLVQRGSAAVHLTSDRCWYVRGFPPSHQRPLTRSQRNRAHSRYVSRIRAASHSVACKPRSHLYYVSSRAFVSINIAALGFALQYTLCQSSRACSTFHCSNQGCSTPHHQIAMSTWKPTKKNHSVEWQGV